LELQKSENKYNFWKYLKAYSKKFQQSQ